MRCINTLKNKGKLRTSKILFSFSKENKQYVVLQPNSEGADRCECIEVTWDVWNGFSHIRSVVPEDILNIGNAIIRWHDNDKKKYPLKGETYRVTDTISGGELRVNIHREKQDVFQLIKRRSPTLLRLIIAAFWVVLMVTLCISQATRWLSVLIPTLTFNQLSMMVWVIELLFAGAMFVLLEDTREPLGSYLNAFVPVGTIILLGVMRNHVWARVVAFILLIGAGVGYFFIMNRRNLATGLWKRWFAAFRFALTILATLAFFYVSVSGVPAYAYKANESELIESAQAQVEQEYRDACLKLEADKWAKCSTQEKLSLIHI